MRAPGKSDKSSGKKGFKIDYVEIAGAEDLSVMAEWDGQKKAIVLIAAFLNGIRLIDNMLLN